MHRFFLFGNMLRPLPSYHNELPKLAFCFLLHHYSNNSFIGSQWVMLAWSPSVLYFHCMRILNLKLFLSTLWLWIIGYYFRFVKILILSMKILLRIVFAVVPEVNLNCRLYSQSEPMSVFCMLCMVRMFYCMLWYEKM